MLSRSVASSLPSYHWPSDRLTSRGGDLASQPVLDITPQRGVDSQFGRLGTPRRAISMPLGRDRAILEATAARRSVATQLARDRRSGTRKLSRDLANPLTLSAQESDLFSLNK